MDAASIISLPDQNDIYKVVSFDPYGRIVFATDSTQSGETEAEHG